MLILDTSAVASLLLGDEAQHQLPEVADAIGNGTCAAPALWKWEVANLLWKARRSKRVLDDELPIILESIEEFGIKIDEMSMDHALGRTLSLANQHGLTAYDAAYLELALRLGADLATYDADLRKAATVHGVKIHPAP